MASPPMLTVLSETRYGHRVPDGFPVACPTLDLSVTWESSAGSVLICRPPDHIVSKIHQHTRQGVTGPSPQAVAWKPDGRFVAVGWSDGYVRLMGLENNKVAHHIQVPAAPPPQSGSGPASDGASTQPPPPPPPPPPPRITHIGWVRNRVGPPPRPEPGSKRFRQAVASVRRLGLWDSDGEDGDEGEGEGGNGGGFSLLSNLADLPKQLTFLEVESSLPDLGPLPSASAGTGEDARVFTLRTGIEFLFQPLQREDWDHLHVMVVGSDDGRIHLNIFDSFVIGEFACPNPPDGRTEPPAANGSAPRLRLAHHAAHPDIPTHSLILQPADPQPPDAVYLAPMDLPFLDSSPINMVLLASKVTMLQKLLRYLHQTRLHMEVEWKNTRELPVRFLKTIQDELGKQSRGAGDIVHALFHSVLIGNTHEPVKEWLVDSVGERGHKRWDKAVVSGLAGLRSLVQENFLPAIDRATIIVSRLRGLALLHNTAHDKIGFTTSQVMHLSDVLAALSYTGHLILQLVIEELDKFAAFSSWLRFRIESLASGNASAAAAKEMLEKEAAIDVTRVLTYIKRFLPKVGEGADSGPLGVYLDAPAADEIAARCKRGGLDGSEQKVMDRLDEQLRKKKAGEPYEKHLPTVAFLVTYLSGMADRMVRSIAEAHRRGVRFGRVTRLCIGRPISKMDATVHAVRRQKCADGVTYTVLGSREHESELWVFRTAAHVVRGLSGAVATQVCAVSLPDGGRFVDCKFLDSKTLLALCCADSDGHASATTTILKIPVQHPRLPYVDYVEGRLPPALVLGWDTLEGDGDLPAFGVPGAQQTAAATAAAATATATARMEVRGGTSARGWLPPRVCLLSPSRTAYTVFALPAPVPIPGGEPAGAAVAGASRAEKG